MPRKPVSTRLPAALPGHLADPAPCATDIPWCGPAALALATGRSYAGASALLRAVAPAWYAPTGPIVTAYWRDLLAALDLVAVPHAPVVLPAPRCALHALVRAGLPRGWYLVRVTDHFLLLQSRGFGLATVHDNRHDGAVLTAATHGRRHVTHMARLLGGPLLAGQRAIV